MKQIVVICQIITGDTDLALKQFSENRLYNKPLSGFFCDLTEDPKQVAKNFEKAMLYLIRQEVENANTKSEAE